MRCHKDVAAISRLAETLTAAFPGNRVHTAGVYAGGDDLTMARRQEPNVRFAGGGRHVQ
jgi:hypothetical protein